MDDPTAPPRLSHSNGTGWLAFGVAAFVLIGCLDLAGALSERLSGQTGRLVSLKVMGTVLAALAHHPGAPARAWPGGDFAAATYWGLFGLLLLACAVLAMTGRYLLKDSWGHDHGGFATPAALREVATLRAARRKARQTRPSLVARLPRVLGVPLYSRLSSSEVGYPLGVTRRPKGVALVAQFETSLRLVAPPGEGKTKRFMEPIGRGHPGPLFATSTKSDLYEGIVTAREAIGPVWALDPDRLVPAATPVRWSPVAGCESTRTAERRAGALIAAGADTSDVRSGEFFRSSARAVLATLLHAAALAEMTMAAVVRWASDPSNPEPLRILARNGEGGVDWSERLARHTGGSEVTTSGVMRTVELALSCFQHAEMLELCSPGPNEGFDFVKMIEQNGTVFALGKDRPGGVGPLVTAFAEELVVVAEEEAARRPARRLDPPLLCLLDEAPSIAPLPGLPALAADGRGRGIVVIYAMQSFSQAKARWGQQGAETLANATTVTAVLGGLKVADDLRELSRLCGSRKTLRHSASSDDRTGGQSVSATWADEPVLDESAIRCLEDGVALVLWGKLAPMLVYMPGSWEQKEAKAAAAAEQSARARNDAARAAVGSR